jgi:DNA-binding NtrC family response regulator
MEASVLGTRDLDEAVVEAVRAAALDILALHGGSPAIRRTRALLAEAARERGNVLVTAEPGLQPEGAAREIHALGAHNGAPCIVVNCASGEPAAIERDLFGTRGGAARTGALERVAADSRVAAAAAGTLVLTNLSELPASAQARLARIARDGEVRLAGTDRPLPFEARLIAAASPDVEDDVGAGRLRRDLFRRIARIRIDLPPLRIRGEDVPLIARELMREVAEGAGLTSRPFTRATEALLAALPWRENVLEVRRLMERLVRAPIAGPVQVEHVLAHVRLDSACEIDGGPTLKEARRRFERDYIAAVLNRHQWRMAEAARTLGIQRPNLYRKARQLGLVRGPLENHR